MGQVNKNLDAKTSDLVKDFYTRALDNNVTNSWMLIKISQSLENINKNLKKLVEK